MFSLYSSCLVISLRLSMLQASHVHGCVQLLQLSLHTKNYNKMPFLKNCLGILLARLIQLLDTTDGLVKTRSRLARYVATALRLDPFEILAHAY